MLSHAAEEHVFFLQQALLLARVVGREENVFHFHCAGTYPSYVLLQHLFFVETFEMGRLTDEF